MDQASDVISPAASQTGWRAGMDFLQAAAERPDAPALTVEGRSYTYAELRTAAQAVAAAVAAREAEGQQPVVAFYAHRGLASYAAVLGALLRGCAYVPLNPKFPAERNAAILARSGAAFLAHRPADGAVAAAILEAAGTAAQRLELGADMLAAGSAGPLPEARRDNAYAYVLFTSGSTGVPKGVAIRHANLQAYLDAVFAMTDYGPGDRLSQNFDLTFDLSVHDMFVAWRAGAHLVVPSAADLENPAEYVRAHQLTCWFSVPTLGQKMLLQGALQPGALAGLRLSLFCGEALPGDLAEAWAKATGQRVENWYGPTEATISCTWYRIPAGGKAAGQAGLVPIGAAFPGMETLIAGEGLAPVAEGESGELLVSGPQVADGYLNDPEKTAAAFVRRPADGKLYYRTGDRVKAGPDGQIQFIGRIDNQIKIRGYRVELGEIEARLRAASNGHNAIAVPLPLNAPNPTALAAAIEGYSGDEKALLAAAAETLPDYMTPSRLMSFAQFPRNASGKIDRGAAGALLAAALEQGSGGDGPGRRGEKRRRKLIAMIRKINPAIAAEDILSAGNLMDAGLDSLGFVTFTVELEKAFGLELDQQGVSALSYLPLRKIARLLAERRKQNKALLAAAGRKKAGGKTGGGKKALRKARGLDLNGAAAAAGIKTGGRKAGKGKAGGKTGADLHVRGQRAINFIETFPALVRAADKPLALFAGSSGFLRGISSQDIEARAAAHGLEICAANAGIGALSVEGIAQLCEFTRDTLKAAGKRLHWGVAELDPMHLSVLPPAGDLEIVQDYLAGRIKAPAAGGGGDSLWTLETRGTLSPRGTAAAAPAEPDWMKRRNAEIRDMFLGQVAVDDSAVLTWLRGVRALAEVSDHLAVAIHPLNHPSLGAERAAQESDLYAVLLQELGAELGLTIIDDQAFELAADDFLDKNHVNWWQGREKFSAQLVDRIMAQSV
ncbi:non-ribosomal peptide synthetase [Leisingera thetidis]|uniref:non-ribosomal peptide synthetase n=1 Tax=Leisingera thetidis TaxID=2930199 RepID=UPI0021F71DDA|nr:non-ribosomal peptide synthetase [Leisingera thetidis]